MGEMCLRCYSWWVGSVYLVFITVAILFCQPLLLFANVLVFSGIFARIKDSRVLTLIEHGIDRAGVPVRAQGVPDLKTSMLCTDLSRKLETRVSLNHIKTC